MARPRKFSNLELEQLARQGLGVSEIARRLGVGKAAISKRLKALNLAIANRVTLVEAGQIVERKIDAMRELEKINHAIEGELDQIQDELKDATRAERVALRELQIKHSAEIRKQLGLLLELFRALYDAVAVSEFQREVLESIKEVAPDVRDKIIFNLQKRRAIRSTLEFH
jgi:predicted transcriptional regulator